jgi:hypothetical protein
MTKTLAARFALGFAIAFALLLGLLHVIEPEFNSNGHLISEYELGNYGWLMSLAFWSLAAASLFLAHSLRDDLRGLAGTIGFWWLLLLAVAYLGAGLFYPDTSTGGLGLPMDPVDFKRGEIAPTLSATLHGVSGIVVIGSSPIVFTLLARGLSKNSRWAAFAKDLRFPTWLAWLGLASLPITMIAYYSLQQPGLDLRPLVSLFNRVMILTYAAWLAICAQQSLKANR